VKFEVAGIEVLFALLEKIMSLMYCCPVHRGMKGLTMLGVQKFFYGVVWVVFAYILFYLISLDVSYEVQLYWTVPAVLVMIVLRKYILASQSRTFDPLYFGRLLIVLLAGMITLRYLWWRSFHSLPLDGDLTSMVVGIILYMAELQAAVAFFLGSFIYLYPFRRETESIDLKQASLPSVDILVPTYNEPVELLRTTLLACKNIRYPKDKVNIYLLDDGGTLQRRQSKNANRAVSAELRHHKFKALCEDVGVNYLTRERNENAKAGNINTALEQVDGDLVVVFDCDHVPTVEFLEETVKPFQDDEKLWLVQTPHFLINEDPVERNVGTRDDMPSESELFYTLAMRGMDFWNAAFFCGSGAVIRRKYLDEIGGIATQTVTEDIETSIELHRRGYNSIYFHKPMLAGLQPETFTGFLTQRLRWAHGMIQVFMLKNPLIIRGLGFWQRLCYLNMTSFWFFSIMRLVFLLAPAAYLVFDIRLYDAPVNEILGYAVPQAVAYVVYFNVMFGRLRWFLVSDMYEVLQSLFAIRTVIAVVIHPKRGEFAVTPKDENIQEDFVSPVARAFYVLLGILGVAFAAGLIRVFGLDGEPAKMLDIVVTFWAGLSFLLVVGSVGVLSEKKQVRKTTRFAVDLDVKLSCDGKVLEGRAVDLSAHGMCLHIESKDDEFHLDDDVHVQVYCDALKRYANLHAKLCMCRELDGGMYVLGLTFLPQSVAEEQEIVALAYGDSERWRNMLKRRNVSPGLWEGTGHFFKVCVPGGIGHCVMQIRSIFKRNKKNADIVY